MRFYNLRIRSIVTIKLLRSASNLFLRRKRSSFEHVRDILSEKHSDVILITLILLLGGFVAIFLILSNLSSTCVTL